MNTIETQFLTTEQVAERYGLSPMTIKDWRAKKYGPPYYTLDRMAVKWGSPRVRYDLHKLLAWEETNNITPIKSF